MDIYEMAIAVRDEADLPSGHKRKKAGDIIDIRPAGIPWSIKERKTLLILSISGVKGIVAQNCMAQWKGEAVISPVAVEKGKRRFNIGLDRLKTYWESGLDLKKVSDPKIEYQPFLDSGKIIDCSTISSLNPVLTYDKEKEKYEYPPDTPILLEAVSVENVDTPIDFGRSPSRKMPVDYNVNTFGNAGRNYTSLATWESDTDTDLVTATKGEVLQGYKDSASYDQRITINGATANASYFRAIMPAAGEEHTGIGGTGFCLDYSDSMYYDATPAIFIYEDFFGLYGVDLNPSGVQVTTGVVVRVYGAGIKVVGNLIHGPSVTSGNYLIGVWIVTGASNIVVNNAIYNFTIITSGVTRGIMSQASGASYIYNNTVDSFTDGLWEGAATTQYSKNNIVTNCDTAFTGANWNQTTDVTSGVTFADSGSGDFRLAEADTGAKDNGTDLSADGYFGFDDDGIVQSRTAPWDVGFYELPTAAATGQSVIMIT